MKCLVTGGTGLVGSNLALHLLREGHDVMITGHEAEQSLPECTGKCLYPGAERCEFIEPRCMQRKIYEPPYHAM